MSVYQVFGRAAADRRVSQTNMGFAISLRLRDLRQQTMSTPQRSRTGMYREQRAGTTGKRVRVKQSELFNEALQAGYLWYSSLADADPEYAEKNRNLANQMAELYKRRTGQDADPLAHLKDCPTVSIYDFVKEHE